jgi:hypothetical protein
MVGACISLIISLIAYPILFLAVLGFFLLFIRELNKASQTAEDEDTRIKMVNADYFERPNVNTK